MESRSDVLRIIGESIDELNLEREPDRHIAKTAQAELFGRNGVLDSLALVTLIARIEEKLQDQLGAAITLADERAMSQKSSPFRSIEALAAYTSDLLGPQNG